MAKKNSGAQAKIGRVSKLPHSHAVGGTAAVDGGELQQIQDLLFGSQAREIDSNLQALEQRFNERFEKMCHFYDAQIQELNTVIAIQAKKEAGARRAGHKAVSAEIESLRTQSVKATVELEERLGQVSQASSHQFNSQLIELDTRWQQQNAQLVSDMGQKHSSLEGRKLDKKALSKLLGNLLQELE